LLVLASTAACGASGTKSGDDAPGASSDSAPNDATLASSAEWQSGTRLRARVLDGGGGASLFSTWFDSERNVECSWAQTAEGAVRCLPRQVSLPYQLYADATCSTSRVVMESDCAPASPYVTFYESGAINPTVYRLGEVLPMPLPPLFEAGPNGCVATTVTSVSGYHLTNATLVANDLFVVVTREREMRGTQLAVDVFATADGARDRRSVLDVARASHCRNMDGHIVANRVCPPDRCLQGHYLQTPRAPRILLPHLDVCSLSLMSRRLWHEPAAMNISKSARSTTVRFISNPQPVTCFHVNKSTTLRCGAWVPQCRRAHCLRC